MARLLLRLLLALVAGFGATLLLVLGLTVVDLYLNGHGHRQLSDRMVAGLPLSISDLVIHAGFLGTAWLAFRLSRPGRRPDGA